MTTKRDIQHPPRMQKLKNETKALVSAAGGGRDAAEISRRSASTISDYCGLNTDLFMPVDVVFALEDSTRGTAGWPIVTRRLALMHGGAFVALPLPGAMNAGWLEEICRLAKDVGEIGAKLSVAAADNVVTAKEIRDGELIEACEKALSDIVNLKARFERIVEEGR